MPIQARMKTNQLNVENLRCMAPTLYFVRKSLESEALRILRRMEEGAEKWALRLLRREEETSAKKVEQERQGFKSVGASKSREVHPSDREASKTHRHFVRSAGRPESRGTTLTRGELHFCLRRAGAVTMFPSFLTFSVGGESVRLFPTCVNMSDKIRSSKLTFKGDKPKKRKRKARDEDGDEDESADPQGASH